MSKMEADLVALYTRNQVPQDLATWLEKSGVLSIANFANWITARDQIEDSIIKASGLYDGDRKVLAGLRMAWREADAQTQFSLKRVSDGVPEVALDEPLGSTQQDALDAVFFDRYHFSLPVQLRPADSLLGRVKREFDRGLPTFLPLSKVKSAFQATRTSEAKRHKAGEIRIMLPDADDPLPSQRFRDVMLRLEVLANAWGLAGTAPALSKYQSGSGPQLLTCEWQDAVTYLRHIKDRAEILMDTYAESSVVSYVIAVEEAFRGHALDFTRRKDSPLTWGKALEQAVEKFPITWNDYLKLLSPGLSSSPVASSAPVPTQVFGQRGSASPDAKGAKGKVATATHTGSNKKICKAFNDSRTCPTPCRRGEVHCCDVLLMNTNRACEQKHPRTQHSASQHGQPSSRPNL